MRKVWQLWAMVLTLTVASALVYAQQKVNIFQTAGTAVDTNSGNKSAGTLRVVLATDQPQLANKLLVTPDANSTVDLTRIAGSTVVADPCEVNAAVYLAISQAASTQIISGTASNKLYICHIFVEVASTGGEKFSVVAGTGSVCATNSVAVIGSTTAANGMDFSASGGMSLGSGAKAIAKTTVNADNLCILQSGTTRLNGSMKYVVAP